MLFNRQALRGIAALLVALHHSLAHFTAMGLSNPVSEFAARHGNIGVGILVAQGGFIACIVFITLLSWVFRIRVEAPLYRGVKSRLRKPPATVTTPVR